MSKEKQKSKTILSSQSPRPRVSASPRLSPQSLRREIEELRLRLNEAEETLRAIREGEVDAVIVSGAKGEQIFSLVGTDSIYRLIVETMKEAAFTVTFEGKILFCNAQFGEFVKRPQEQIVGHPLQEYVAGNNHAAVSSLLLAAHRQPVKQRLVFQATDGTEVPAHVSANILNQPDGLSICVVANDLTDLENSTELIQQLRQQQEATKASEERFRSLFENSMDAMFLTTPAGRILDVNPAACVLFGRSREMFRRLGEPGIPAADVQQLWEALTERARTGAVRRRMVFLRPNGDRIYAEISSVVIRGQEGQRLAFITIRDVTKQTRAEDVLRESEERFRSVLDNCQDVIYRLNVQTGHFEYINPSAATVTGYPPDELAALPDETVLTMIHPDDQPAMQKALAQLTETGKVEVVYRQRTKSGAYRWLSNRMSLIRDSAGRPLYRDGNIRDITERKQAEERLRVAYENLARQAEELTHSNHELEQFAHVVSHDLKEPLRMVTAFTGLLKDDYAAQLDARANEYISFTTEAATRMQELIDDMLAYARAGRDKSTGVVDSNEALKRALENLQMSIMEAGAQITWEPLPTVPAHERELSQVFQNLIGNALKFRNLQRPCQVHIGAKKVIGACGTSVGAGAPSLMISDAPLAPMTQAQPAPDAAPRPMTNDSFWLFTVRDNGIGIDPQYADRIFTIFQRLHVREAYPGTGVGLAICKKIVERHGGRIWEESEPDQGTTFCFTLPAE